MNEVRNCQNCKNEFHIEQEDFVFYEKINVPAPTWCPDCRNLRRCAYRNERTFYSRACDLCKKQTLSTYGVDAPFPVYCPKCWRSDAWDPMSYGRDYNFSRPFFEQYNELSRVVPHIALSVIDMENSYYCHFAEGLKDSYLAICNFFGKGFFYTYWIGWSEDLVDCNFILHSERLYQCQDVQKSYNCRYVYNSHNITDSAFCFASSDCVSCFMCVNLKHKSYCIKNIQYTKEEYEHEMQKYNLGSHNTITALQKEFWQFASTQPRKYAFTHKAEDSVGNYLRDCKDVYRGFDVYGHENGRYFYDVGTGKDCMDLMQFGLDCELDYEGHDGGWSYNTHFADGVAHMMNCEYIAMSRNCEDCFGCFGIQKKQYNIFNKQYAKEEYEILREKIIDHMKKTGEYGEFFPVELSPYAYNETVAQQWYPKTKAELLAKDWKWRDDLPGRYDTPTIQWTSIPDNISDTREDIIKNIFACQKCEKNYKIIKSEFEYYTKNTIPLPRQCPDCRFYERFARRNPRQLWHRRCMKTDCANEFETTYAPERSEIVYCESCYQKEVA